MWCLQVLALNKSLLPAVLFLLLPLALLFQLLDWAMLLPLVLLFLPQFTWEALQA